MINGFILIFIGLLFVAFVLYFYLREIRYRNEIRKRLLLAEKEKNAVNFALIAMAGLTLWLKHQENKKLRFED